MTKDSSYKHVIVKCNTCNHTFVTLIDTRDPFPTDDYGCCEGNNVSLVPEAIWSLHQMAQIASEELTSKGYHSIEMMPFDIYRILNKAIPGSNDEKAKKELFMQLIDLFKKL